MASGPSEANLRELCRTRLAGLEVQMASGPSEANLREECRTRLAGLEEHRSLFHPDLHLGTVVAPPPGGDGDVGCAGRHIRLADMMTTKRVDGVAVRAWVVSGESGRGKSTIACSLAAAWSQAHPAVMGLEHFKAVLVLDGLAVATGGCWEAAKTFLSETVARWGPLQVAEWLETATVLVIIDDFLLKKASGALEEALQEWTEASFLLLTTPAEGRATVTLTANKVPSVLFNLEGLDRCDVLTLAGRYLPEEQLEGFSSWLATSWSFTGEVLSYPRLVAPACLAWRLGAITHLTVTVTQFMWSLIEAQFSQHSELNESLLAGWLLALGALARRSLESLMIINREELLKEARKLLPSSMAETVALSLPLPLSASAGCLYAVSLPHPLIQFLAGWDVIHQVLRGTPLKSLVKRLQDEDTVVLYAAGHLSRLLYYSPDYPDKQVARAARNLVLHMDRAKDRFGYTLKAIHECRIESRVLRVLLDEVEFPKRWEVCDGAVLVEPLTALLRHATPEKIHLTVGRNCMGPDLEGVVAHLAKTTIPIFLAEMNHLEWDNPDTSDSLVAVIQRGRQHLQDFIGCLNTPTINSLCRSETTRYLVCLRVRVTDNKSVEAILKCPRDLPSLMWLEVDFDVPLRDLDKSHLPQVNTPLMDVCFKDICDNDVALLCDLLAHIRSRYSGVHMTRSALTPQGVTEVLKYFYKRGMMMTVDSAVINRYRRWRFPVLETIPMTEELTDDKVRHLLGYDDRYHYSENEVWSSVLTTSVDARALANFFIAMEDLLFFRYVCANFSVIKNTDGTTEVKELVRYL
nr:uncharacterized protein LOC123755825 isoform X1 [Procambarus clarkii]XP_045594643.1 uncharacterized protein LOC123755825 isoform X1 [Procambarus clarkii]